MLDEVDKLFMLIEEYYIQDNSACELIGKAYRLAKNLHGNQIRKGGEPYIVHPVEVALILAKLGFDENVISAALLHDVVEDCGVSLDEIKSEFNHEIAELVDCVSAIDKEKYVFDENEIFEDEDFEKASIEERSFKKLIEIGKKNPLGFCIKFADRLHNLRTIDCFVHSKQLEKVKETEKWIVPIAKILNSEYFYRAIKNECFRIRHKYDGKDFFEQCENYHKTNAENIEKLEIKLKEIFAHTAIKSVRIKNVRQYKKYQDLSKIFKNINIKKISQGQILKVTNYNIYLLFEGNNSQIVSEVLNIINKRLSDIKIIDAKIGSFTKMPYYQLEDKFKNKFNLYIESYADYIKQRNGTLDGQDVELIDSENIDNLEADLIKVKTRSGEIKFIAKGATALDFAFKIHREIGFGFKYAIINGSKTKSPPYAKIYDGDQVEIIVAKNEQGETINNAQLKWLAYVNTDQAKKNLIKHFQRLL